MAKTKTLTNEDVKHIAKLALIKLSDDEIETFRKQLEDILQYVEVLEKFDSETPPEKLKPEIVNIFREDTPEPSLSQEEATSGKNAKHGFFTINQVITDADE